MASQLDASLNVGAESAFGVAVVPDQAIEFTEESLSDKISTVDGEGLRPGKNVNRLSRRSVTQHDPTGSITMEAPTKGLGWLLKAALGTVTNQLAKNGTATAVKCFQQVHTLADLGAAPTLTIQKGVPVLTENTIQAFTFDGVAVKTLDISAKQGGIVEIQTDLVGHKVTAGGTFAPLNYPDPCNVFTFVGGELALAADGITSPTATDLGAVTAPLAGVTDIDVKLETGIDEKGYTLGSKTYRGRAPQRLRAKITGKLSIELTGDGEALAEAFLEQAPLGLLLTFQDLVPIEDGFLPTLQVWVPAIILGGDLPQMKGAAVRDLSIDFDGLDDDTNPPITIVYRTTDTEV